MKFLNLLIAAALLLNITSCSDDDDKKTDNKDQFTAATVKTVELDAKAYEKWTYFSFTTGEVVVTEEVSKETSRKNSTDWDIAFHRMDIKLNGGESGSGKAEVAIIAEDIDQEKFEAIKEVPANAEFVKDVTTDKLMVGIGQMMQGGQPDYANSTIAKTMKWVAMKSMGQYDLSNQLYIIKTAQGKYVKLWMRAYKDAKGDAGKLTFMYEYQADGSKIFKK